MEYFQSVIVLLCHTKVVKLGHCEGRGFAKPSQQRNPDKYPLSTKYMNAPPKLLENPNIGVILALPSR